MPDVTGLFRLVLAHAGDAADPELLHWIKDQMDSILGLPPWGIVAITAGIIVMAPLSVIALYLHQQRRQQQVSTPDDLDS